MENEEHEEWWMDGEREKVKQARNFFYAGFFLLPGLWFVNVFYFWPALAHPPIRPYVVWSAIGFIVYTLVLVSWALTFSVVTLVFWF
ncbi:hypothetical protein SUGI_0397800 [Cryptomeria japonica]|nr:hypothetical protein SUGI_0397800 [Cryptomeria japonica]